MVHSPPTKDTFRRCDHDHVRLDYDTDIVPEAGRDALLNLPEIVDELSGFQSRSSGRESVWKWSPTWTDTPLFIREFVHGGILRHVWGAVFLTDRTMHRELRIGRYAWGCGLPTCRPVALRVERFLGIVRRAFYVTQALPEATNLLSYCERHARNISAERRQNVARDVGRVVADMHELGIYHRDLNLKNLLILPEERKTSIAVIDFKKARRANNIDTKQGLNNLIRLDRSILKWPASRQMISVSDRLRAFQAYIRSRCGTSMDWKRHIRRLRPNHWIHYFGRKA